MFGSDFWHFNVMELFASLAIVIGVVWACIKWWNERKRKLNLISFPDKWSAHRYKHNDIFEVHIVAEVYYPHHTFSYKASAEIKGEKIQIQFDKPQSAFVGGRWIMGGKTTLSSIPIEAKAIELSVEIQIDGGLKKKSGKRTVIIIDS